MWHSLVICVSLFRSCFGIGTSQEACQAAKAEYTFFLIVTIRGLQFAGVANSVSSSGTAQNAEFIENEKKRNRFNSSKQKAMQDDLERWARLGGFGLILVISKPNAVQCEVIASSTAADVILEQGGAFLDPSAPVSVRLRSLSPPSAAPASPLTLSHLLHKVGEWRQVAKSVSKALAIEFKAQARLSWFPSGQFRQATAGAPLFISQAPASACHAYILAALPILSQDQFATLNGKLTPPVLEVRAPV